MPKNHLNSSRIIWTMWWQGIDKAPPIIQTCTQSWIQYNTINTSLSLYSHLAHLPPWQMIHLNHQNLKQYLQLEQYLPDIQNYSIGLAHKSDLIRMLLLKQYGGIWIDASLLCNLPLDLWLPYASNHTGFFVFSRPRSNAMLSNWFIYAEKEHPIINRWLEEYLQYWQRHKRSTDYFHHHLLFRLAYQKDPLFQRLFHQMRFASAIIPHSFQWKKNLTKEEIITILNVTWFPPVFKLTYRNLTMTLQNIAQLNITNVIRTIRKQKRLKGRLLEI